MCPVQPSTGGAARADFDGDGVTDLAVGIPGRDVAGVIDAGAVAVFFNAPDGLGRGRPAQVIDESRPGMPRSPQQGGLFGSALAACDFDGDGVADLAVGVPGADGRMGAVEVVRGGRGGLSGGACSPRRRSGLGHRSLGDGFGSALLWAELGRGSQADLVVGAPGDDDAGQVNAGAAFVVYGGPSGLTTSGAQRRTMAGGIQPQAQFGEALAAGDLDGDGHTDLAAGAPLADTDEPCGGGCRRHVVGDGSVTIVPGGMDGLRTYAAKLLTVGSATGGTRTASEKAQFATALAAGDRRWEQGRRAVVIAPARALVASSPPATSRVTGRRTSPSARPTPPSAVAPRPDGSSRAARPGRSRTRRPTSEAPRSRAPASGSPSTPGTSSTGPRRPGGRGARRRRVRGRARGPRRGGPPGAEHRPHLGRRRPRPPRRRPLRRHRLLNVGLLPGASPVVPPWELPERHRTAYGGRNLGGTAGPTHLSRDERMRRSATGWLARLGAAGAVAALVLFASPAFAQTSTGGSSTGTGGATGGSGGGSTVDSHPTASSGGSGDSNASSTATNTGNTGPATATAVSNPVATSGQGGSTSGSAAVTSSPTAVNTAPLAGTSTQSGTSSQSSAGSDQASSTPPGDSGGPTGGGGPAGGGSGGSGGSTATVTSSGSAGSSSAATAGDANGSPVRFSHPVVPPMNGSQMATIVILGVALLVAGQASVMGTRISRRWAAGRGQLA